MDLEERLARIDKMIEQHERRLLELKKTREELVKLLP